MARHVDWSHPSHDDFRKIVEYISRDSIAYASAVAGRLLDAVDLASDFPEMGRIVPEFDDPTIRELLIHCYRIIYRIEPHRILIAAVIHGARELPRAIEGRVV